jgi:hypothetical protein
MATDSSGSRSTDEGEEGSPLVAVRQRMVAGYPSAEHGGLVDEIGIEVDAAEGGSGSGERGLSKIDVGERANDERTRRSSLAARARFSGSYTAAGACDRGRSRLRNRRPR